MTVQSNTEFKIEAAWISALGQSSDLGGVTIRRADDTTDEVNDTTPPYEFVTVNCESTEDQEFGGPIGYDMAIVELRAITHRDEDKDTSRINQILGAVRDITRHINILPFLNITAGLTVYATRVNIPSQKLDDSRRRIRMMSVTCHATASDIPELSSTSSSESSSSSS